MRQKTFEVDGRLRDEIVSTLLSPKSKRVGCVTNMDGYSLRPHLLCILKSLRPLKKLLLI